jgi:desulfoferrodoxin-like iron-binding protein
MAGKLQTYRCERCGSLVAVRLQGRGDLRCCGLPLQFLAEADTEARPEQEGPLLDLVEKWVDGQSWWQLPPAEPAAAFCLFSPGGREGCAESGCRNNL